MGTLTVAARIEELESVQEFIQQELDSHDCSPALGFQINIVVEEVFANIAYYAYPPDKKDGLAWVDCHVDSDTAMVCLRFCDAGIPFNPLERQDPDITTSLEEKTVGGLGIFMVKQMMDEVVYEYKDGRNQLSLKKKIS